MPTTSNSDRDDATDAAERAVDVGVHLSPPRAVARGLVEVLNDDNFRSRLLSEVLAIGSP